MTPYDELLDDLADEHRALDAVLARMTDAQWDLPSHAPGWLARDQVAHLAHFDEAAALVECRAQRPERAQRECPVRCRGRFGDLGLTRSSQLPELPCSANRTVAQHELMNMIGSVYAGWRPRLLVTPYRKQWVRIRSRASSASATSAAHDICWLPTARS